MELAIRILESEYYKYFLRAEEFTQDGDEFRAGQMARKMDEVQKAIDLLKAFKKAPEYVPDTKDELKKYLRKRE